MPQKKSTVSRYPDPGARQPRLAEIRNSKMATSAHAYVRGNARHFYTWLARLHAGSLPEGPGVWICGDCHIGNLGPVADADGDVAIQIRDLDQTVIGNPAHDLIRLGLSLATAARSSDLPGVITARMMAALIDGYEQAFDPHQSDQMRKAQRPAVVRVAMKEAVHRSWRKLARQSIAGTDPSIPLGKRFWPLSTKERKEIHALFETGTGSALATVLRPAQAGAKVKVLDAAYWVKGCSSLGRLRYAVLVDIGHACADGGAPCLVDIKEAIAVSAPRYPRVRMPRDNAQRVVEGARHLSPFLGDRMNAARLDGRAVVLRELLPQDLKLDAEKLGEADAVKAAHFLALVVGRAHASQMDGATRKSWLAELRRSRERSRDTPSWLWLSVVELISIHEAAYLEHCRGFAAEKPIE
ncbi:DUF2252 family protein [Paraburkholderia sp. BL10I2N1]|uniref:DUF2252 family protein n=1 Tax=Paraburkholderia sp. BL10I2N1 TaxID=1938796 RepID=UPI00105E6147|nr:DUF2252 family protein [Paraburkholderia sp. BL10I2N1]TDN57748.1 uncharacterized protein (DUF2252 family) [Paraburkholderia sp. BL10I2N1]